MGGKDIRKSGTLVVLLLTILVISGCAENAQDNKTGPENEERITPVEDATPNVTEQVTEPASENTGEGSMSGQEETSMDEGKEVIIPDEENSDQGNETSSENLDNNLTIIQTAEGAGYTTFASLARDAGLEDILSKGGPYTVFAPTDIAFESLPEGTLDDLRNDKERLNRVLTCYVINGEYMASDLKNVDTLDSLETEKLTVNTTTEGQIMVEDAIITEPDIVAGNGVVHGIDKLVIPLEV
ncbi:Secreted and surface protein containing fasciclin-like repeats [Methanosarcina barkeri 3]|uniref:Secreted and surface protein containing fasciclin-like repeats n=1 Tax=Methanosarcina barkeri 3 TaxID=1434107 RepID=A0A0E3SKN9_METBA|nr:fasciclin domain-containing protein [Methanosarcina barkeri]AKB81512.1 Secreted and surface protein containing fasciclin-like repeats [Methanosarcina barkeri 3]